MSSCLLTLISLSSGLAGRGVLLDYCTYARRRGIEYSPFESYSIPVSHLQQVAVEQGVQFCKGDILLIRTGWTEAYHALPEASKLNLPRRPVRSSCGVAATYDAIRWHWDSCFAAVASDTVAYEAWPSARPCGVSLHEVFLSGWGMMIGELWDLERLAQECAKLEKWTFFLTSHPLNVEGGIASPSNAVAIL